MLELLKSKGRSLKSGNAGHDLLPSGLIFGGQPMVAVQDLPVTAQHLGFALPASPAPAQVRRIDTGRFHGFEQGLRRADGNGLSRGRQIDGEGLSGAGGQKLLVVEGVGGPSHLCRGGQNPSDHALAIYRAD